jgi:hypothetical protein
MNEAIESVEDVDDLVRLWAHEGLRLFHDRLVEDDEKEWYIFQFVIFNIFLFFKHIIKFLLFQVLEYN